MKKFLFILLLCSLSFASKAQRFGAGLSFGINMSELDQTGIDSYVGLTAGVRGIVKLKKQWHISTEILYSQQGDYVEDIPIAAPLDKILLEYIEVPIQAHHLFVWNPKLEIYQIQLNYGLTYARLIDSEIVTIDGIEVFYSSNLPNNVLLYSLGITGYFNQHFGVDWRGTATDDGKFTLSLKGIYLF